MFLILISPPENTKGELDTLKALFTSGLEIYHLRKPEFSLYEIEQYLKNIPSEFYSRIVIHSHYSIATSYPLRGIHLTEKSRTEAVTKDLVKKLKNQSISASFHSLEDIELDSVHYNYMFLSPIFDSISKKGYNSNIDLNRIKYFIKLNSHLRLVALGGISGENMDTVKQVGFSGAALLGAVWESKDPVSSFIEIKSKADNPFL